MTLIHVDGLHLEPRDVWKVAVEGASVALAPEARERMARSHRLLHQLMDEGRPIYGVNTGFGALAQKIIPPKKEKELQKNLIRSHAAGVGKPLSREEVRALLLLRAQALARGYSGVRPELAEFLLAMLNAGVHPVVPSRGSLGASGDLAPLAHLALVVMGEGEAEWRGKRLPGGEALRQAGLTPMDLGPKEGLALINGTQAMTALGVLSLIRARHLVRLADLLLALDLEALGGNREPFLPEVQAVRGHRGQAESAAEVLSFLEGSRLLGWAGRVQDAYSLRCGALVHGATRQALHHVEAILTAEMRAATDNPLVFPETGRVISAGNFHGQPLALALDYLAMAVAELGNISERRLFRLLDPQLSGLPPFLTRREEGLHSGLMILQYTAASLVAENKVLCTPASVDSIPSSANQEDHVSMGMTAALKGAQVVENTARILALELVAAVQALEFHDPELWSPAARAVREELRERIPPVEEDRSLGAEVEALAGDILALRFPRLLLGQ
ncbi:MAG: histidine ammonia-lyase [Clostridiales bacterium]|nr:histidine ammonia-lyase [Clostridiales bacterium]